MKSTFPHTIKVLFFALILCSIGFLLLTYPYHDFGHNENLPDYVTSVWPEPNETVWLYWYDFFLVTKSRHDDQYGISVRLDTARGISNYEFVDKDKLDKSLPPFYERVYLFLNGRQLSNSKEDRLFYADLVAELRDNQQGKVFSPDLSAHYILNWVVDLYPGKHKAKLLIKTRLGEVLEYEWGFTVK